MSATGDDGMAAETDATFHRVDIDWDRREPVSFTVQTAISDIQNEPVTETDPLADYVDPDALEAFFDGDSEDRATRTLTFDYDGHSVHVDGAGHVVVD